MVLHAAVIILVSMNFNSVLKNLNFMVNDVPNIDLSLKPILQFPDLWQNLTYISGFFIFKMILAIIVITSVSNEYSQATLRQNVIDGFSKIEWLISKLGLIKILALFSTAIVFCVGMVLGYTHGKEVALSDVLLRLDFVLAYFIDLTVYCIYALFLAVLMKRTGLAIVLLLVYDIILETALAWTLPDAIGDYLPINVIDNLNTFPFIKYMGEAVTTTVSIEQLVWAIVYGIVFTVFSFLIIKKRDL